MSDSSSLAHQLTERLFDLSATIDLIGQAAAARLGINQTDLICLNLIYRNGPMSAGEIAAKLGLTTAAISAMATRLERGGYARREVDREDRRRVLMHAEPAGAAKAFGLFDDLFAATSSLCETETEADLRSLVGMLERFQAVIAAQAASIRP